MLPVAETVCITSPRSTVKISMPVSSSASCPEENLPPNMEDIQDTEKIIASISTDRIKIKIICFFGDLPYLIIIPYPFKFQTYNKLHLEHDIKRKWRKNGEIIKKFIDYKYHTY
jgi:hypothetical protein